MTVLMVGDVVGGPGRRILRRELKGLKARFGAAAAVVNAENCAAGSGITAALAEEIFDAGADAITLGDHTWGQKEFAAQIGGVERLVRPASFAAECPGRGWCLVNLPVGRLAVLNLQGRVFMQAADCPFKAADRALAEIPKDVPVVVDAGLGAPSHAAEAMEMGADAVLVNTAIAVAGDPVAMARAFRLATEAGRTAYLAGLGNQSDHAEASSPLTAFLDE